MTQTTGSEGMASAVKTFCYHIAAFVILFNMICNMAMFWKSWILTYWPHPQGGWSAGKIFATMWLHLMIPFNLICNMTIFWKVILSFWSNRQGRVGRGSVVKIFATMLLHSWISLIWYATWPWSEKDKFWPIDHPQLGGGGRGSLRAKYLLPCCCIRDSP